MNEIKSMLNAVKGVKKDWKEDFKETSKADWKFDFDAVPGNAPSAAPTNSVLPAISGSPIVGSTLSASTGTWAGTPAPTFTYQWKRGSSNISGATSATYVVTVDDVGQVITVKVRGANAVGNLTVTSDGVTGEAAGGGV